MFTFLANSKYKPCHSTCLQVWSFSGESDHAAPMLCLSELFPAGWITMNYQHLSFSVLKTYTHTAPSLKRSKSFCSSQWISFGCKMTKWWPKLFFSFKVGSSRTGSWTSYRDVNRKAAFDDEGRFFWAVTVFMDCCEFSFSPDEHK